MMNNHAIPSDWKKAIVVPIYKVGDRSVVGNHRLVSLTSVVCKQVLKINHCFKGKCMSVHNQHWKKLKSYILYFFFHMTEIVRCYVRHLHVASSVDLPGVCSAAKGSSRSYASGHLLSHVLQNTIQSYAEVPHTRNPEDAITGEGRWGEIVVLSAAYNRSFVIM
jgi:hypothetical protein